MKQERHVCATHLCSIALDLANHLPHVTPCSALSPCSRNSILRCNSTTVRLCCHRQSALRGAPVLRVLAATTRTGERWLHYIFAEGLTPSAKAIRPSAKALPRLPSAKSPRKISRRQRDLCRGPFVRHSAKILLRADADLRGKKRCC